MPQKSTMILDRQSVELFLQSLLVVVPVAIVTNYIHEWGHALSACLLGYSATVGLNNTEIFPSPSYGAFTLFSASGPLTTVLLGSVLVVSAWTFRGNRTILAACALAAVLPHTMSTAGALSGYPDAAKLLTSDDALVRVVGAIVVACLTALIAIASVLGISGGRAVSTQQLIPVAISVGLALVLLLLWPHRGILFTLAVVIAVTASGMAFLLMPGAMRKQIGFVHLLLLAYAVGSYEIYSGSRLSQVTTITVC